MKSVVISSFSLIPNIGNFNLLSLFFFWLFVLIFDSYWEVGDIQGATTCLENQYAVKITGLRTPVDFSFSVKNVISWY